MHRRNHRRTALLLAAALLVGALALAPAAAAEAPRSPLGWVDTIGQSVTSWWAALAGDGSGQRGLFAASQVAPEIDPDGNPVAPELDPNGNDATISDGPDGGNDVAPEIDPNG